MLNKPFLKQGTTLRSSKNISDDPAAAVAELDQQVKKARPVTFKKRGGIGFLSFHFHTVSGSDTWTLDDASLKVVTRALRTKEMVALVICTHQPFVCQTYKVRCTDTH